MRSYVLGLAGAVAFQVLAPSPVALAADLGVTTEKPSVRVVHRKRAVHRSRIVRDYDGTPVAFRLAPRHLQRDGAPPLYMSVPAPRATPSYWLNGQPIRPTTAIRWGYRS